MSTWPFALDTDADLIRVDDDLTEIGGQAINQMRDAIFNLEAFLGLIPQGSVGSVANRLDTSLNADGSIKASALTSIGLVTLPITDSHVANNAGIQEFKLALDYTTTDLHTLIVANETVLNNLVTFASTTNSDLLAHISGATTLLDGSTPGRHVTSQIDINAVPSDPRDPSFVWTGLLDKDGVLRTATNAAEALLQINDDLTGHENTIVDAHPATAITVDTSNFSEIPFEADTVQKALNALDDSDRLQMGVHQITLHSNGVPRAALSEQLSIDGYSQNIVPSTPAAAFLINPPAVSPVDSNSQGDDIIIFAPDNTGFVFDSQFSQVQVGDIVTINYGNGLLASFPIDSIRFIPDTEWVVRINGLNLFNIPDYSASARIDKSPYNTNTSGVVAVAAANNDIDSSIMSSLVVGSPRGATALGLGFNADELGPSNYNLYLQFYPNGNPVDRVVAMPAIDVTGNAGITPGQYTIESVVESTNNALRAAGYNLRFIAYEHNGEFGIMLADSVGEASFSIVNGSISGASIIEGIYTNNVIGDTTNGFDALGFGATKANLASPPFLINFPSTSAAANFPTRVFSPLRRKSYIVNGIKRDTFAPGYFTVGDGYWSANLTNRVPIGVTTVEVTYTIPLSLEQAGLKPGKTIVVQPTVSFSDPLYRDVDYGRFIIKSVSFSEPCDDPIGETIITVVNGIHATGTPVSASSSPTLPVRLYFSDDSVSFDAANIIDPVPTATIYNRLHEVYVDENGHTFTHERGRLPKQDESPTLLGTNTRWTITDVSPKLRGWRDDGSANLNKYIRFYVLSYDSASGVYDGYIGKRNATNPDITKTGRITTARKNIPSRFYDETNIDYIEVQFFDETATPGQNIMSTDSPRYVDIEVFPSLELNQSFMLLATCELDDLVVQSVTGRRSFGNTSEKDLTQSAIDFINSGDKYLHENGVIVGMDFIGVNPGDPHLLNFNGGIVLVNGNKVAVNSGEVAIPEIRKQGDSLPALVNWAICVNETGQYVPIVITTSKEQYFATTGSGNYYIPSVTWDELIALRKDLTVIAGALAVINSITLVVFDARRYVTNVGFNTEFTLTSDDKVLPGSFRSIISLQSWINSSKATRHVVKVRGGNYTLSAVDVVAFANFTKTVVFDASDYYLESGQTFTFTFTTQPTFAVGMQFKYINMSFTGVGALFGANTVLDTCILAGSGSAIGFGNNAIIKDSYSFYIGPIIGSTGFKLLNSIIVSGSSPISFIIGGDNYLFDSSTISYAPTGLAYGLFDHVNAPTGCACIISGGANTASSRSNITIQNCEFTSVTAGTQRPPMITFISNQGDVLKNINIRDNKFIDPSGTQYQCAIIFLNLNLGVSTVGGILANSNITNNYCNRSQSIILTTSGIPGGGSVPPPGFHVVNTIVDGNTCGNIGYIISSDLAYDPSGIPTASASPNLVISNNNAKFIGSLNDLGNYQLNGLSFYITHNTGDVVIKNNSCNWINSALNSIDIATKRVGTLLIDGNICHAADTAYLTEFLIIFFGSVVNSGISVWPNDFTATTPGACRIVNNYIGSGFNTAATKFDYTNSIFTQTSALISNNNCVGLTSSTVQPMMYVRGKNNIITGNTLYRGSSTINSYIRADSSDGYVIVSDNILDKNTVDGTVTDVILIPSYGTAVRNKNQLVSEIMNVASAGKYSIKEGSGSILLLGTPSAGSIILPPLQTWATVTFSYATGAAIIYEWYIDLGAVLPKGVRITYATATITQTNTASVTASSRMFIVNSNAAYTDSVAASNLRGNLTSGTPLVMNCADLNIISGSNKMLYLTATIDHSGSMGMSVSDLTITYSY